MSLEGSLVDALKGAPARSEPDVPFFTITPRTIRFGHGSEVYPLRAVARIGKFRAVRWRMPMLVIAVLVLLSAPMLLSLSIANSAFGLPALIAAGWGLWTRLRPDHFVFGVQISSGGTRFLRSKDEQFIDRVIALVTSYLEESEHAVYQINMENVQITRVEDRSVHNSGAIFGSVQTGDVR